MIRWFLLIAVTTTVAVQISECFSSILKMLSALREQQEVNRKLKDYVDKMLVDVLERAPHLLEVRRWKWRWEVAN